MIAVQVRAILTASVHQTGMNSAKCHALEIGASTDSLNQARMTGRPTLGGPANSLMNHFDIFQPSCAQWPLWGNANRLTRVHKGIDCPPTILRIPAHEHPKEAIIGSVTHYPSGCQKGPTSSLPVMPFFSISICLWGFDGIHLEQPFRFI